MEHQIILACAGAKAQIHLTVIRANEGMLGMTASNSWPSFRRKTGAKVDNQVAAPTELGTPTMHRAKIAQPRVRMEGWRQGRPGSNARNPQEGKRKQKEKNTLDSYRPSHGRS
jgi:hypothetical protein